VDNLVHEDDASRRKRGDSSLPVRMVKKTPQQNIHINQRPERETWV
jgi:hypothetical protein